MLALRSLLPLVLLGACARSSSHGGPVHEASSASAHVKARASAEIDLLRPEPTTAEPRGLGHDHRAVSTRSPVAQRAFDDGLELLYSGDPDRAARRFRDAARTDPTCAASFFGLSLALAEAASAERSSDRAVEARAAADAAARVVAGATPVERALVDALAARYRDGGGEAAFAQALAGVATRFPADLDAKTLYARVAIAASGELWPRSGEPPRSTLAVVAALEDALARDPRHPGANEAYVRALVGSPHPERALTSADRLARLEPKSAAFAHVAARLYHRVGRYAEAAAAEERALALDAAPGLRGAIPPRDGQRAQHEALLVASCVEEGRAARALEIATNLSREPASEAIPEALAAPALVLARFGRYGEVLEQPAPPSTSPLAVVLWRFARGIAAASQGHTDAASGELASLAAAGRDVDEGGRGARGVVDLAATMLEARIAEARGDRATARRMLEDAVARQDALSRDAALPWLLSARDALGLVLLDDQRPAEAEAVYRRELEGASESAWTLLGLAESLRAQGRMVDATIVESRFRRAFAGDTPLRRSRL